ASMRSRQYFSDLAGSSFFASPALAVSPDLASPDFPSFASLDFSSGFDASSDGGGAFGFFRSSFVKVLEAGGGPFFSLPRFGRSLSVGVVVVCVVVDGVVVCASAGTATNSSTAGSRPLEGFITFLLLYP